MNLITLEDPRDYLYWQCVPGKAIEIVDIQVGTIRGRGRGRELINRLLVEARDCNHKLVFARTRVSNKIAQEFYTKVGFRTLGILHKFYRDVAPSEDAISFGFDL